MAPMNSTPFHAAALCLAEVVDRHAGDYPVVSFGGDGTTLACVYAKLCFDIAINPGRLADEVELFVTPHVVAEVSSAADALRLIGLVESRRQKTSFPLISVDCR